METKAVVTGFYEGLGRKDASWQNALASDVAFSDGSGRLRADGRDAFIKSFDAFLRSVEGVTVKSLIVDGPNAAAVVSYEYRNPRGERLHQDDAEIWKVEDGAIKALTIYFDITEFRAFMSR